MIHAMFHDTDDDCMRLLVGYFVEPHKALPSGVQITNYKTGIFSISVLSGTKQGEKDKIHAKFCLFHPVLYPGRSQWSTKYKIQNSCFVPLTWILDCSGVQKTKKK